MKILDTHTKSLSIAVVREMESWSEGMKSERAEFSTSSCESAVSSKKGKTFYRVSPRVPTAVAMMPWSWIKR